MITLAIEQSTKRPSAGIFRDGVSLAEMSWGARTEGRQHLLTVIGDLAEATGVAWTDIDRFLVGLGPGSFSGIRTALAAAMGIALPDQTPLVGIPSPEVLAWQLLADKACDRVTVVGDARRRSLWVADYAAAGTGMTTLTEPALVPREGWRAPDHGGLLATPDWDRLSDFLETACGDGVELLRELANPVAAGLVGAAHARTQDGRECDPPQPLYLHPAVSIEPTFPRKEGA